MPKERTEQVYVLITIDTECDHDPHWVRSRPLTFNSINDGLPNRLQPAFDSVGAVPTYLLTVEVMEDEESVESLRKLQGKFEFGTHLHAAFIEPEKKFHDYAGVDSPDFQCNYAPQIEFEKLRNLSTLFETRFGYRPTSFRAGRYGASADTIDSLERLGYTFDTSVTPHIKWSEPNGEVDFRGAPEQPYFPSPSSISTPLREGKRGILEVPVTLKNRFLRFPRWFRPWLSSREQMRKVAEYHLRKYAHQKIVVLNMMFHSMEVIPGATPYPQDETEARRFIDDMLDCLQWCADLGMQFSSARDLARLYLEE